MNPDPFRLSDFDYALPEDAIAQVPADPRSSARLLVDVAGRSLDVTRRVADLPDLLEPGDVVVVNDTRVLPARLHLRKTTGGAAEVLLLEPDGDPAAATWRALVRPGRRLPPGSTLVGADGTAVVEVGERMPGDEGLRLVRLLTEPEAHGVVPLPPYVHEPLRDSSRYQTVYARNPGSVAAPTAGLHLDLDVLDRLRARGIELRTVDLAVGLDTFRPIAAEAVADHKMHSERYVVPEETMAACERASGRVVAIGTTSVRALESAAARGELTGRTDLFIRPGFEFRVVDVLLTNFHLPKSSLLVLLSAFAGHERWRRDYDVALREGFRFLSFGDAMLVDRQAP